MKKAFFVVISTMLVSLSVSFATAKSGNGEKSCFGLTDGEMYGVDDTTGYYDSAYDSAANDIRRKQNFMKIWSGSCDDANASDDSVVTDILRELIREGTWLDRAIKKEKWHPILRDLFVNYSTCKADSVVRRCEELLEKRYGCLDSITDDCNLQGIYDVLESDSCFLFLYIIGEELNRTVIGYGMRECTNPITMINWYKRNRLKISSRAYRLMTLFKYRFPVSKLDSLDMKDELKYRDKENIKYAIFIKKLDVRTTFQNGADEVADSLELDAEIDKAIYDLPFADFKAENGFEISP